MVSLRGGGGGEGAYNVFAVMIRGSRRRKGFGHITYMMLPEV